MKRITLLSCLLAHLFLPALVIAADPANFANPVEKVIGTAVTQAVGVIADVPGVIVRGGDRVNMDYANWYAEILASNDGAYLGDLVVAYESYRQAVAATVASYNATKKKTRHDKRAYDQNLVIANAWFQKMVADAQIRNRYTPKFKYDSPKMMAQVTWGTVKGGLNYDWQVVDRVLGTAANVATAPFNNNNHAPGVWESGPIHQYMCENDVANVAKLAGAIAAPIAGGVYGVTIAGQAPYTAAATMGLTATCAHGAQVFFTALDEANKRLGIVK